MSRPKNGKKALARSKSIDSQLEADREKKQKEIQLLILGGAGTGKSTFIKQLRIHFGDAYPEDVRKGLLPFVYENITDAIHTVLDNMTEMGLTFDGNDIQQCANEFQEKYPRTNTHARITKMLHMSENGNYIEGAIGKEETTTTLPNHVTKLFEDVSFQKCYGQRNRFKIELTHSEVHFLDNLNRISQTSYVPNIQDILYMRQVTLGVTEHSFTAGGLEYRAIDVAGQKSQRKKWICFFEGVTAVIFFVSLSGYCESLEEESTQNSLLDSLQAFIDVVKNEFLKDTDTILFLNKHDIFLEKLKIKQLQECFPDYSGENSPDACLDYIKKKFQQSFPAVGNKQLYMHVSCATDTTIMKNLIDNILQVVVEINLKKAKVF